MRLYSPRPQAIRLLVPCGPTLVRILCLLGLVAIVCERAAALQGGGGGGNGPLDRMVVDPAAADRGRPVWAAECITCHGPTGRGGEGGPNILRSEVIIRDRSADMLGPFLKKGHSMQSGRASSALTDAAILDLSHFLRQRFTDTFRGSPLFVPGNILVGDPAAGSAFFSGEGKCTECHSANGDLAGTNWMGFSTS
jgi:cytochrome c oxidase cbb3-type subunit III